MTTKTVTIDEDKLFAEAIDKLNDTYTLCYVDYRDEIPANIIQRCLDAKSLEPLETEEYYHEARRYSAIMVADAILSTIIDNPDGVALFKTTSLYDELVMEIEARDDSNPERDAFKQTTCNVYVRFHSNYDCWLPLWEQGGIQAQGTALAGIMAALSFNPRKVREAAIKKGVTCRGPFRNLPSREGKEVVDYDKFIEVLCETPNYGNWSFFGEVNMPALYASDCSTDGMLIPKGATCAIFNWWNGSGSYEFCETLRDVSIKELKKRLAPYKDDLKVVVDKKGTGYGYTPSEVYGGRVSQNTVLTNGKTK